ncbi:mechanosensitive ion channel family protein, partial [Thioalkalivibrio sp.]|uniref:mechanosensitive ion channel family protein n=1 Tax=Thioalkalivibrio sp. TaxID=2093813 RepID=UPI0025F92656
GRIKTQPIKQWMVGRAFNHRIKKRFDELGIEIPFPHRTVYFGQDKDGTAPPLQVSPGIAVHGAPTDVLWPQREPDPKSA